MRNPILPIALSLLTAAPLAAQQASYVLFPIAGDQAAIVVTNGSASQVSFAVVDEATSRTIAWVPLAPGASRTVPAPAGSSILKVWTLCEACDFRNVRAHGYSYSAQSGSVGALPWLTFPSYAPYSPRSFSYPPIAADKAVTTWGPHGGIGIHDPDGGLIQVVAPEGVWDATVRTYPVPSGAAYVSVSPAFWSPATEWTSPPRNYSWATAIVNGALVVIE